MVSLGLFSENGTVNSGDENRQYRAEVVSIGPKDRDKLGSWARHICRGRSVEDLAASLGVPPNVEDIVSFLSQGLPKGSASAVKKACEQELAEVLEEGEG